MAVFFIRLLQLIIRIYQCALSPMLGSRCRFFPSCSEYSYLSFERHGLIKGLKLTLIRLSKCTPFHPGGVDIP